MILKGFSTKPDGYELKIWTITVRFRANAPADPIWAVFVQFSAETLPNFRQNGSQRLAERRNRANRPNLEIYPT